MSKIFKLSKLATTNIGVVGNAILIKAAYMKRKTITCLILKLREIRENTSERKREREKDRRFEGNGN